MIKKWIIYTSFTIIILTTYFLIGECIIRYEQYGLIGFSEIGLASINPTTTAGYVLAGYPCSTPPFKVNYSGYFKGVKYETNSLGIRDKEYNLTKSNDTFRILVLGNSYTQGHGVKLEEIYHSILEDLLNNRSKDKNFELWNFGPAPQLTCGWNKTRYLLYYSPDMIFYQDPKNLSSEHIQQIIEFQNNLGIPLLVFTVRTFKENISNLKTANNSIFILALGINHAVNKNSYIYPADSHPNKEIHKEYAYALYDYFIKNEDKFYSSPKPIDQVPISLEENNIPYAKTTPGAPFFYSYFLKKIKDKNLQGNLTIKRALSIITKV